MRKLFLILFLLIFPVIAFGATSDSFPPYIIAPAYTAYLSGGVCAHSYYISTSGSDSANGAIGSPWASLTGATNHSVTGGDCIFYRGGTYPPVGDNQWLEPLSLLKRNGSSNNYIVVTTYSGEIPIFQGAEAEWSQIGIWGNYIIVNGLTFGVGGNALFYYANNVIFQNNTFNSGSGADGFGDQVSGGQLWGRDTTYLTIRNNYFGDTNLGHAIKSYNSGTGKSDNWTIQYNSFYGNSSPISGAINQKGSSNNWEISYNLFESIDLILRVGQHYQGPESSGLSIHHNAFDNVDEILFQEYASYGVNLYSNIFLNGATTVFDLICGGASGNLGTVYDNAFYGITDLIYCQGSNYANYPTYWDYNADTSTAIRDTAKNRNNVSGWQSHDVIQVSNGIISGGTAGNRFYTIEDTNGFLGKGRYGGNIGGFSFVVSQTISPPTGLQIAGGM